MRESALSRFLVRLASMRKSLLHLAGFSFLLLFQFTQLHAQQQIEEVVVEAEQSDDAPLEDVGSVAVLGGEKLADAGIDNVEDVAAYVPNLVLTQTETGTAICVRGICPGTNQGFDQSVGLYSDGVPLPRANMARAPFLDLSSVQILRGPQYVRDGNYSIAGSIHMVTNLKTDEFGAGIDFNFVPSQDRRTLLLTAGGPIGEDFAFRVALQSRSGDNYVENVLRENQGTDELLARFVFGYEPTDWLSFKLKYETGSFNTDGRNLEIIHSAATPTDFSQPSTSYPGFFGVPNIVNVNDIVTPVGTGFLNSTFCRGPAVGGEQPAPVDSSGNVDCGRYEGRRSIINNLVGGVVVESDLYLAGISTGYDQEAKAGTRSANSAFNFPGLTPHDVIAGQYELFAARSAPTGYIQNVTPLPRGFMDVEADFSRASDVDERSENDLDNITLNVELALGPVEFDIVGSRVEYDAKEVIDSDFLAVSWLETEQNETFQQDFYKVDFSTPEDEFLVLKGGVSYLESELEFADRTAPNIGEGTFVDPATNIFHIAFFDSFDDPAVAGVNDPIPGNQFLHYLGAGPFPATSLSALGGAFIDREFSQTEETQAAYLELTANWSDTLKTTIGARYTNATKQAERSLCFVDSESGQVIDIIPSGTAGVGQRTSNQASFLEQNFYIALGIQLHCGELLPSQDGINFAFPDGPISGERNEELLLPSISTEWDATEFVSFNVAIKTGNKLGGFDARSLATPFTITDDDAASLPVEGSFEFEDETAITYELGSAWYLPNGEIRSTLFYTEFKDLQTSRSDGRIGQNVGNAGEAVTAGIEIEGFLAFSENFTTQFSLAYIDFEFKDFGFGACYVGRRPDHFFFSSPTNGTDNTTLASLGHDPVEAGTFIDILYPDSQVVVNGVEGDFVGFPVVLNIANIRDQYIHTIGTYTSIADAVAPGGNYSQILTPEEADRLRLQDFFAYNGAELRAARFCDFEGQTNQYVADWQGTLTFDYQRELGGGIILNPSLDILYNSGYHTALNQDPRVFQDEYTQFNARIALESAEEVWTVALVGENLTNEVIIGNSTLVPATVVVQGAPVYAGFVRPPRSIGLNFRYNFY